MSQPVLLLLLPADAVPIGPVAGLVEGPQGGVVYVSGLVTFVFAAGDEVGRRLAAVQLVSTKIATAAAVARAFGVGIVTLWRWTSGYEGAGVAGLIPAKTGPKGPSKLTEQVAAWIRDLDGQGLSLAAIAARSGVSTATVRVALGRRRGSAGWEARQTVTADAATACGGEAGAAGGNVEGGPALPVLPMPRPRTAERELARTGLLPEAPPVFTEGAHLPLAGLLLILPALAVTGLVEAFEATYGRLRNGFYGLRATLLMLLFLALLRDPRAEGATRIRPADLGRLLGLDRAPEVKTLRRKLIELAGHGRGAQLQSALAKAHAAARPQALGFLHVDGHVRVYSGTRDLPKTHIARMHLAGHATNETWIADADADPVLVVTAPPAASLAAELVRLLPDLRTLLGPDRRATVIFDRGGWSPDTFAKILAAGMDVLTYRKAPFDRLGDDAFTEHTFTDPDGDPRTYQLAQTTVDLPLPDSRTVTLRQIHRKAADGAQIPVLTSRTDLPAAELCWRLSARWRQENYFKYARAHFALDALDSYADTPDDPDRPGPQPRQTPGESRRPGRPRQPSRRRERHRRRHRRRRATGPPPRQRRHRHRRPRRRPGTLGRPRQARPGRSRLTDHPQPPPAAPSPPRRPTARRATQTDHPRHPHHRLQRRNHPHADAPPALRPSRRRSPRPTPRSHDPLRRPAHHRRHPPRHPRPRHRTTTQPRPARPLPAAHRHRNHLPRHPPQDRLRHQTAAQHFMIEPSCQEFWGPAVTAWVTPAGLFDRHLVTAHPLSESPTTAHADERAHRGYAGGR